MIEREREREREKQRVGWNESSREIYDFRHNFIPSFFCQRERERERDNDRESVRERKS